LCFAKNCCARSALAHYREQYRSLENATIFEFFVDRLTYWSIFVVRNAFEINKKTDRKRVSDTFGTDLVMYIYLREFVNASKTY